MIQAVIINGVEVPYVFLTKNICKVLGFSHIYANVSLDDTLRIIHLGLERTYEYSTEDFITAVRNGDIHTSRRKQHYTLPMARKRLMARIRQINKSMRDWHQ